VFGMGTGDPSQYGHRQIEALSGRLTTRAEILTLSITKGKDLDALCLEGAWRVVARSPPQRL
jgi:hypothetical protein